MPVKVIIPTALRQHTNDEDELQLNSRNVKSALQELVTTFPNLRRYLYSDNGKLRNFINIYLNEEDVRYMEGEETPLKDGDTLMIVPAVAGGSVNRDLRNITFSGNEFARYSRHLIMPEVGLEGQRALKASSVLIIGAGGLGTPSSLYLAAAGVGRIGIVDFDNIEKSNLHRQILYSEQDIGRSKAEVAKEKLLQVNPNVSIELHKVRLESSNALDILKDYDIIMDGTDNFPTRYLVNDACVLLGKPNVYASIFRFEGQASVFYAKEGPCYRCLYPEPPPPGLVPSCAEGGVLGVLPGIMGSIQAAEAIDLILGKGTPLIGRLLLFNALDMKFKELKLIEHKIAAADFICCISSYARSQMMKFSPYGHWHKLVVSRLGVDPSLFAPRPGRDAPDVIDILCVGRLTPAKGQHILIDAVERLSRQGRRVRLRLVGQGPDGPSLRERVRHLGDPESVVFEGAVNQDRIRTLYAATDIFCIPSFAEGIPVVLMEAMAMEIPCVTTHITGIPELIRDGLDGLLVPPSDVEALVEALAKLMDDADLRERLGKNGRLRILKHYDLRHNVETLAAIFTERVNK